MIVQILTISLGVMPVTVRQELVSGTIERFLVSAHGPVNGILGTSASQRGNVPVPCKGS